MKCITWRGALTRKPRRIYGACVVNPRIQIRGCFHLAVLRTLLHLKITRISSCIESFYISSPRWWNIFTMQLSSHGNARVQNLFSANDAEKIRFHHAKKLCMYTAAWKRKRREHPPEIQHRCLIVDGIISGNVNE